MGASKKGVSTGNYALRTVDYAKQQLSISGDARGETGRKLAAVGQALQEAFDGPQDVEGAIVGGTVYIVQTRPQP